MGREKKKKENVDRQLDHSKSIKNQIPHKENPSKENKKVRPLMGRLLGLTWALKSIWVSSVFSFL